ncbi:hypothetical protein JCM21738_4282 [Mesobacillus boroniphilus JCM 21738]|uniref:Uncharacterized protein n=1 Tax=Mesobacillus boroniphilus JCM 21738 TaxID=1294265 RepID=W4RSA7_9BACI|nr:hypothetical protein JCM21738_4282 [Mesobacillus boroniphilus JCM 21738]
MQPQRVLLLLYHFHYELLPVMIAIPNERSKGYFPGTSPCFFLRKAQAPWSAPKSVGGPDSEVVL